MNKELHTSQQAAPQFWDNKVPPLFLALQADSRTMYVEYQFSQSSCLDQTPKQKLKLYVHG